MKEAESIEEADLTMGAQAHDAESLSCGTNDLAAQREPGGKGPLGE